MKARASSLNPYATSYVPLSRRGAADDESTETDAKIGNSVGWVGHSSGNTTQNSYSRHSQSYEPRSPDNLKLKNQSVYASYGSSSQSAELAGKQALDVDHDMNLAYLQMTFPGVSDESLSSVYAANRGDMEATVEMLNQLEVHSGEFSENLPESLDIGDVSEGGSQKLKKVVGGEGSSSVQAPK